MKKMDWGIDYYDVFLVDCLSRKRKALPKVDVIQKRPQTKSMPFLRHTRRLGLH